MRHILYLNRSFFSYDKEIEKKLKEESFEVHSYSIKLNKSLFSRIVFTILPSWAEKRARERQQQKILESLQQKNVDIDVVLVVAGHKLLPSTLESLKRMYPEAKFIWYIWDGIKNLKEYSTNKVFFDSVISFDKKEASEEGMSYLPLFYIHDIKKNVKKYDLTFIGTVHSRRVDILAKVMKNRKIKKSYIYMFAAGGILLDALHKMKEYKLPLNNLKIFSISYNKAIQRMAESKCVLDISHPGQTGLTMRTIETLGVHTKLITTNAEVVNYDFYNPENIYVIKEDEADRIDETFFENDYVEVPNEIFNAYSIENWIDKIIGFM